MFINVKKRESQKYLRETMDILAYCLMPTQHAGKTCRPAAFSDLHDKENPHQSLALSDGEYIVHAWGQEYIYQVRYENEWVDPNDDSVLRHKDHDWVTLITCKGFNEQTGNYRWRTVIQAVLVDVVDK